MKIQLGLNFRPKLNPWQILRGTVGLRSSVKTRPEGQQERFMRELVTLMDRFEVSSVSVTRKPPKAVSAKAGQPSRS